MKTVEQIKAKNETLKKKLIDKAERQGIYENFGDSEMRQLDEFIGDFYAYSWADRKAVDEITLEFFSCAINYTG